MEQFKVENFLLDHRNIEFPSFQTLTSEEVERIVTELANVSGFVGHRDARSILRHLLSQSFSIGQVDSKEPKLDLVNVLVRYNLEPSDQICINWSTFTEVDCMSASDFSQYFDYIWYPASDDIEVWDDLLEWILFVTHYGDLRLWRAHPHDRPKQF